MSGLQKLARTALTLVMPLFACMGTHAQPAPFPVKPITLVVPYAAGGTADLIARVLADRAGAELGQAIVIDNRSGGNGVIGAVAVAHARPDGYTLLQLSTAHAILPSLQRDIGFDWKRDFTPFFGNSEVPQALAVNGKSNIKSMDDLAATAKAMSSGVNYASGGTGSISHLTAARVVQALKVNSAHVPYRGLGAAVQAVLGNQVQFAVVNIPDVFELAKSGDIRVLAVTSRQRLPLLPSVPTMAELGFNELFAASWTSYVAPAGTPPEVIERLYAAFARAAGEPAVQERLGKLGVMLAVKTGNELGKFMNDESIRWRRVIEDNKIKLEN